MKTGSVDYSTA